MMSMMIRWIILSWKEMGRFDTVTLYTSFLPSTTADISLPLYPPPLLSLFLRKSNAIILKANAMTSSFRYLPQSNLYMQFSALGQSNNRLTCFTKNKNRQIKPKMKITILRITVRSIGTQSNGEHSRNTCQLLKSLRRQPRHN